MTEQSKTLYCRLQNRLGALDRVVLALTHRGIVPEQLLTRRTDEKTLEVVASFDYADRDFEKLVKFLQKQVYVLEANGVDVSAAEKESQAARTDKVTHLFTHTGQEFAQRRFANANNA